jgi:hypothetical protein
LWHPPLFDWIKCNFDGVAINHLGISTCGKMFRNSFADHLGSCVVNVESGNALFVKLTGATLATLAIELAVNKGWNKLRLETYSKLVVLAFNSIYMVPYKLRIDGSIVYII